MSSALRTRILTGLYGADAAPRLAERIDQSIAATIAATTAAVAGGSGSTAPDPWSHHSVWLITYGDQVGDGADAPLVALKRLVDGPLADVVDGVHILPFYPSTSDGGFAVVDYLEVDPAIGSWADVEAIATERPVMFDAVVNHLSASSPWFLDFLAGQQRRAGYFRTGDPSVDHSSVVRPRTHPLFTPFTRPDGSTVHVWTTFSADQVDLDYANPEVLLDVVDTLLTYVGRGAAAIRLDAVGFLWKDEADASIHRPETHDIIRLVRSCVDEVGTGTILVSETNVPHEENISYLNLDDPAIPEVSVVYQFPLAPLTAHAVLTGDASVLTRWIGTIDEIVGPSRSFLNFLASHDGIGLRPVEALLSPQQIATLTEAAEQAGGRISMRSLPDGSTAPYELNTTWFDLMAVGTDEDTAIRRHLAAHAVALALPGIAAIYAHSLVGSSNDHDGAERTGLARNLNRERWPDLDAVVADLADPSSRAGQVLAGFRAMTAARRSSPAFHPEGSTSVAPAPDGVVVIDRRWGDHRARVIVNLSPTDVDVSELAAGWRPAVSSPALPPVLPGYGNLWLVADR